MRDRIRRSRLRLLQLTTEGAREPFTPPMLSASPRALRWIDADGAFHERALDEAYEAIWYGTVPRLRGRLDDEGKLRLRVERPEREAVERRLVRIPGSGDARYFARWEHARDRAVLSPKGAGVILDGKDTCTIEQRPAIVDVYAGDGVLLALRNVPNGARVVAADGVALLAPDALVSDVQIPDVAKPDRVEVDPDALLTITLQDDLAPTPEIGRIVSGKPAAITLSDGRRYRLRGVARERLPRGDFELVVAALLDDALLVEVCAPVAELTEPTGQRMLDALKAFWLGLSLRRP